MHRESFHGNQSSICWVLHTGSTVQHCPSARQGLSKMFSVVTFKIFKAWSRDLGAVLVAVCRLASVMMVGWQLVQSPAELAHTVWFGICFFSRTCAPLVAKFPETFGHKLWTFTQIWWTFTWSGAARSPRAHSSQKIMKLYSITEAACSEIRKETTSWKWQRYQWAMGRYQTQILPKVLSVTRRVGNLEWKGIV